MPDVGAQRGTGRIAQRAEEMFGIGVNGPSTISTPSINSEPTLSEAEWGRLANG